MSCKYSLLFLFLCGFAALSVSEICNPQILEGTSCTFQLPTKTNDQSNEIKWVHLSSDALIHKKGGRIKKITLGLKMEGDGSLTFDRVSLNYTGKYTYTVFNAEGTQIDAGEKEIKVYAKAPKPTVTINCKGGVATLSCDIGDRTDLTVSWYEEGNNIQNVKNPKLLLTAAQVQENKPYTCNVSNPVSYEQSDRITVSCATGEGSGPRTLFGFDFWIMVTILVAGGALLLLLICVLVICACRSCKQQKKYKQEEDELRLRILQDQNLNGTARSKHTARGQPAPPIPQEDPSPQTPTQTQPKAQTRARPPPPPEDDEEYPPPLPHPRNKQHRKRHEEPYRPVE